MTETVTTVVADAATLPDMLETDRLALIGTMTSANGPRALLRNGIGRIRVVNIGDTLFAGRVIAIDDTRVVLSGLDGEHVLELPY